jgi:hypothetical protein
VGRKGLSQCPTKGKKERSKIYWESGELEVWKGGWYEQGGTDDKPDSGGEGQW